MVVVASISIVLIPLTLLSFVPQILKLHRLNSSEGLSLAYVFSNLIVATHHFTIAFSLDVVAKIPANTQELLNFTQFSIVLLGHLILLTYVLALPQPHHTVDKIATVFTYLFYLLSTLFPAIAIFIFIPSKDNAWFITPLIVVLTFLLNIPITLLGAFALWFQVSKLSPDAVSVTGLWAQAIIFFLVGISMFFRVTWPADRGHLSWWEEFRNWYRWNGCVTVDTLIFASVQATLAYVLGVQRVEVARSEGERQPLLRGEAAHSSV